MPPRIRPRRLLAECSQLTKSLTSTQNGPQLARQLSSLTNSRPASISTQLSSRRSILPSTSILSRRTYLTVPALPNEEISIESGIAPLYNQEHFFFVWKDYQNHLLDRLNLLVAGTELEHKTAVDIAIQTSRNSDQAAIFNYASAAHNNQFFFEGLSSTPSSPSAQLLQMIQETFSNVENFKQSFIATALACFSNAYVWLVVDEGNNLRILATYNSGTPYASAHRRQTVDTNTTTPSAPGADAGAAGSMDSQYIRTLGEHSMRKQKEVNFLPIMCVNVWQHAWVPFYGFDGKEAYLENWWSCIDWGVVYSRLVKERPSNTRGLMMGNEVRNDGGGYGADSLARNVLEKQRR